jgi:hypothetical protein
MTFLPSWGRSNGYIPLERGSLCPVKSFSGSAVSATFGTEKRVPLCHRRGGNPGWTRAHPRSSLWFVVDGDGPTFTPGQHQYPVLSLRDG